MPTGTFILHPSSFILEKDEIARGLNARPQPWLPAKFLYDEAGSALFDLICDTPEYYPTRTEQRLLAEAAADVARRCAAAELVELGAGHARKTAPLLGAMGAGGRPLRYVPVDVSEPALRAAAARVRAIHPDVRIAPVVADFEGDTGLGPAPDGRLVAFLGGTIGNFEPDEAAAFLRRTAALAGPQGRVLLGADLVKGRDRIHAAYNDRAGVTARFNLNTLSRLQRDWEARLDPGAFVHDAHWDEDESRVEMHVRAVRATRVRIPSLGVDLALGVGASIRTEISRKFTMPALHRLFASAGLEPEAEYVAQPPYALVLARTVRTPSLF